MNQIILSHMWGDDLEHYAELNNSFRKYVSLTNTKITEDFFNLGYSKYEKLCFTSEIVWDKFYKIGDESGKGIILNGKKEGYWVVWDPRTRDPLHIISEVVYRGDLEEGMFIEYQENGTKIVEECYSEGVLNGPYISYQKDGIAKRVKGTFVNGRQNGIWTYYYADGITKEMKGSYVDGKENGIWTYYSKDGKVAKKEKFIYGEKDTTWNGKKLAYKGVVNGVYTIRYKWVE